MSTTSTGPLVGLRLDGAADPVAAARAAEDAGFALAVYGDPVVRSLTPPLDAVQLASAAAPRTHRIALVAESEVVFPEPFHLATQLASLDFAAEGRSGWWVAAHATAERAATYGRTLPGPDAIRREVADVVDVARRLWDSWEDDAVIRDVTTGRYLDGDKLHHVDFTGATFSISGPLITPRPPQGNLPVLGLWDGSDGARFDVAVIAHPDSVAEATRAAEQIRDADVPRVLIEVEDEDPALLRELSTLADVLLLAPTDPDAATARLGRDVLPLIGARSPEATLRASLGLPRPASRYARTA